MPAPHSAHVHDWSPTRCCWMCWGSYFSALVLGKYNFERYTLYQNFIYFRSLDRFYHGSYLGPWCPIRFWFHRLKETCLKSSSQVWRILCSSYPQPRAHAHTLWISLRDGQLCHHVCLLRGIRHFAIHAGQSLQSRVYVSSEPKRNLWTSFHQFLKSSIKLICSWFLWTPRKTS